MDKMNGNNGNNSESNESNHISTNSQTNDSVDNQMNLSFGKKRFFGKKGDSGLESQTKSVDSQSGNTTKKSLNKWPTISASNSSNQLSTNNTNGFKSAANDLQNEDKFLGEGIQFSAKLIGHEFVAEARGEQMCQQSLKKLKILHKGLGGHKRKVHLFISFEGIKIRDATTSELIYHHSVPQISFISRDESDTRAFGYVFGSSTTGHQFIAFKTQKEAMPIMSAIGQLFAATLMRKKSEIINESVTSVTTGATAPVSPITSGAINEEKIRRESSATLRPSRSESPNVPSMPAPPVPTKSSNGSAPAIEEIDFFSAFEPMDSVFESDFKVNKEKLDQMPITGTDPLSVDPFANSFGSLSLSSGDWANFDEDNSLSASGSSHQPPNSHPFAQNSKPFDIQIVGNRNEFQQKPQQLANSFNDSSSSMALNNLFNTSGHHNPLRSPALNSEAMPIPQRNVNRNNSQSAPNNQSVGSTTSSTDRYACFAEIHSISSSIFDSMCDQMAVEADLQMAAQQKTSKSLNSSLNGGFGVGNQQQLSSSLNKTGDNFYYSFDNPLNSETQKQNFLFANNYQNSGNSGLSSQQNTNEFNAQNVWNNNNFNSNSEFTPNTNNSFNATNNQSNNVWSTSSSLSDRSLPNSQISGASSPPPPSISAPTPPNPMTTTGFGINRSNDMLNEINPVFAELDPLGKDRPFVDRSQFFADQKQKPTLKDLNNEFVPNNRSMSANSVPFSNQINDSFNQTLSNVSVTQSRPLSSNANPFVESNNSSHKSRVSPNPFNPFSITTSALNPRPPSLVTPPLAPTPPEMSYTPPPPLPPPRPPSRDSCPPVPPRNDLNRESLKSPTPEAAPPLPRRRTLLPEHRYQSFDTIHRQSVDPFSPNPPINAMNYSFSTNNSSNYMKTTFEDTTPAPPLPNPQRKVPSNPLPSVPPPQPMARKLSSSSSLSSGKTNHTSSWDPFNCSFVDLQLSSMSSENAIQKSVSNSFETNRDSSDIQLNTSTNTTTSTPKQSSDLVPNMNQFSEDWKLSGIKSRYDWISESIDKNSESSVETPVAEPVFDSPGFSSDFSPFSEEKVSKHNLDLSLSSDNSSQLFGPKSGAKLSKQNVFNNSSSVDSSSDNREDHISPPERNIFIPKTDPFADDFFA